MYNRSTKKILTIVPQILLVFGLKFLKLFLTYFAYHLEFHFLLNDGQYVFRISKSAYIMLSYFTDLKSSALKDYVKSYTVP